MAAPTSEEPTAALVVDAAPLVAAADRSFADRGRVQRLLSEAQGRLVLPAPVSAEADYLLATKVGRSAQRAFLADLTAGRFEITCMDAVDHAWAADLDAHYADLQLGLADLSIVVAAEQHHTRQLLTFNERHFRTVAPPSGGTFTLLPADAGR